LELNYYHKYLPFLTNASFLIAAADSSGLAGSLSSASALLRQIDTKEMLFIDEHLNGEYLARIFALIVLTLQVRISMNPAREIINATRMYNRSAIFQSDLLRNGNKWQSLCGYSKGDCSVMQRRRDCFSKQ